MYFGQHFPLLHSLTVSPMPSGLVKVKTGTNPRFYRNQFHRDIYRDLNDLQIF
ncbi:hypothetical protein [Lachnoclostridium sp. Marseille-P6806]|uniref:hypothetical protein n=1 Tax=Lachnoclostridium sp. Marseille-P6806 TaxID=2364793 RepID=UPI0013EF4A94|nr:hypothetical protein [Lachnoclostridium sp. Marseille-P6806]